MTPEYEEDVKREDEELATLGGKTRLVPRKASSSAASSPTAASASPRSSPAVSNIIPSLPFASALSTPPQSHPLALATPIVQANQQAAWQPYEYQNNNHHHYQQHPTTQPVSQAHHAHSHSQPQVSQTHNHNMSIDHQAQPGPRMSYNHTQYWQHQQTAEYPYNGMHAGPSTSYMPTSPGGMGFDYAASLRAESYLASMPPQQPSRMQVNSDYSPGTDPSVAWNDLVAQFNHV